MSFEIRPIGNGELLPDITERAKISPRKNLLEGTLTHTVWCILRNLDKTPSSQGRTASLISLPSVHLDIPQEESSTGIASLEEREGQLFYKATGRPFKA